jgi:hypothetical protein
VAERAYVRSPLILDGDDHPLEQVSASLSVLGLQQLYADDLEELTAIAADYRTQAGALLLPATRAVDWWPAVRKRVIEPLGLAPRSVLPVGAQIADSDAESLHCDGLRWALWEPYSPFELRFAVSLVLSETDEKDLRIETRVPCAISVAVESQSRTVPAQLTDLSTSGACVQLDHPHPEGTPVVLRGQLCGWSVTLPARVAWRSGPHSPSWRDRGMGVVFERVELGALDLLRQQMHRALDRFRLRAR